MGRQFGCIFRLRAVERVRRTGTLSNRSCIHSDNTKKAMDFAPALLMVYTVSGVDERKRRAQVFLMPGPTLA